MKRVFSKLPIQEIIDVVNQSTSKSEVFNKLGCSRNSRNIKLLDQIIKDHNLDFSQCKDKNKDKNKNKSKGENKECPFCHKEYTNKGLNYHIKFCKQNPNHKIHCGNKGKTKGKTAWNKGLTAKTNESVRKQSESLRNNYKSGKIIPVNLGTHHSEEQKQKIREGMIKYIEKCKGSMAQHYNINSGEYIEQLNKDRNWNLQYYGNGGEIQVCGYFLDGYDKDLNIAFEYDEAAHYEDVYNNILKEKDIIRQNNIIKSLNCEFWRYNERINLLYKVS